ncbi:hypothetical protein ACSTS3_00745 [Aquimarina muelleri]|uniref:hypothetical protein n=1 Tax=Aquimarina muelleri TaxID=279356 RepID=UPI003F6875B4
MKNTYIKIFFVLFASLAITSCEDEDKNPLFIDSERSNDATFVTIAKDPNNLVIDFTKPETSYKFTISAPANNVAEYDLRVKHISNDAVSKVVSVKKATSFPADFSITRNDVANALGVNADSLIPGDEFKFESTATGTNGQIASFSNLNGDSRGSGQFQGFNHTTSIICPFDTSDNPYGTYTVISDGFVENEPANTTFEVIPGPTDDTAIVTGLYTAERSFTMSINLNLGTINIEKQVVADTFDGFSLGTINTNTDTSFFFSCTGKIILNLLYADSDGDWGDYKLIAKKN